MISQPPAILVTRPIERAAGLSQKLQTLGFAVIRFPTIVVVPNYSRADLSEQVASLAHCQKAIFTSLNAADIALPAIVQHWEIGRMDIFAVGAMTAQALMNAGANDVYYPTEESGSDALLTHPALQIINNETIALLTGARLRTSLAHELRQRGARVHALHVYARLRPTGHNKMIWQDWRLQNLRAIIASSQESLENLLQMVDVSGHEFLHQCILVTFSRRIYDYARQCGFTGPIGIVKTCSDAGIVQCLHDLLNRINE